MTPAERLSAAAAELRGLPVSSGRWGGQFAEALAAWLEAEAEHVASYDCMAHCEPAGCDRGHKALAVAALILPADSDRAAGQGQVTA